MANKNKRKSRRSSSRKQGLMDFAKDITFRGAAAGVRTVNNLIRGKPLAAARDAISHVGKTTAHLVQAITGRNDKAWYTLYREITPAVNPGRPMEATFNTSISRNPFMGGMARMFNFDVSWKGLTKSVVFNQMISNSYQLIRLKLKSNLPYDVDNLGYYLNNAIALAVAAKQLERDVHWVEYFDETMPDFQEQFKLRSSTVGQYGVVALVAKDTLISENYATTIADYSRLVSSIKTTIKLPRSLAEFISHYFGTVFVDSMDNQNDQYIIMNMHEMDWYEITKNEDGKLAATLTSLDVSNITVAELQSRVTALGKTFGMLLADLVNSEQYVNLLLDEFDDYTYYKVYDTTFLQAVQNAYTDANAVQDSSYIRLDYRNDVDDNLTGFLFLGAINPEQEDYPGLTMLSMTAIFPNDEVLKWPVSIVQTALTQDEEAPGFVSLTGDYIGLEWVTTIPEAVYTYINNQTKYVNIGTNQAFAWNGTDPVTIDITLSTTAAQTAQRFNLKAVGADDPSTYLGYAIQNYGIRGEGGETDYTLCVIFRITRLGGGTEIQYTTDFYLIPSEEVELDNISGNAPGIFILPSAPTAYARANVIKGPNPYYLVRESGAFILYTRVAQRSSLFTIQFQINESQPSVRPNDVNSFVLYDRNNNHLPFDFRQLQYSRSTTESSTQIGLTVGYVGYAGLGADVADFHIPLLMQGDYTVVSIQGEDTSTTQSLTAFSLLKEEYIPYWYNILDLKPTIYNMFESLFSPTNNIYEQLMRRKGEIRANEKKRRNEKRKKEKESGEGKSSDGE